MGSVEECRHQIVRELRYQSSMDLEEQTYSAIRHLPLARELVRTSRQQLVSHLDSYCRKHNSIFKQAGSRRPSAQVHAPSCSIHMAIFLTPKQETRWADLTVMFMRKSKA